MKQTHIIIKVVCNLHLSSMPRIYFSIILNELLQNMARCMACHHAGKPLAHRDGISMQLVKPFMTFEIFDWVLNTPVKSSKTLV